VNEDHPPSEAPDLEPSTRRPFWPIAVGVVGLLLALPSLLLITADFLEPVLLSGLRAEVEAKGAPPPPTHEMTPARVGRGIVYAAANLLLVAAAIAALARLGVARGLHLAYALLGVVSAFASVWFQIHVNGQTEAWIARHGELPYDGPSERTWGGAMRDQLEIGRFFVTIGFPLALAWPLFCIVFFGMLKRDPGTRRNGDDE